MLFAAFLLVCDINNKSNYSASSKCRAVAQIAAKLRQIKAKNSYLRGVDNCPCIICTSHIHVGRDYFFNAGMACFSGELSSC